jgi:hypothetical protein
MGKIVIGYERISQVVKAAVSTSTDFDISLDVMDMLRSGLTVSVIEAESITIGFAFDWSKVKESKL